MARCTRTTSLEVHHRDRNGGNELSNAEVLCTPCHEATQSYGTPGRTSPDFTEQTKREALSKAQYRCECTKSGGCH